MGISGESSSCIQEQHPFGNDEAGDFQRAPAFDPNPAVQLLDDLWPLINDYCGSISRLMGKQHPFAYVERPSFTLDMCTMRDVNTRITVAKNYMWSLLIRSNEERENLVGLARAFVITCVELAKLLLHKAGLPDADWSVTEEDMLDQFVGFEKKYIMSAGHMQLVTLNDTLARILNILEPESAVASSK